MPYKNYFNSSPFILAWLEQWAPWAMAGGACRVTVRVGGGSVSCTVFESTTPMCSSAVGCLPMFAAKFSRAPQAFLPHNTQIYDIVSGSMLTLHNT